MAAPMASPPNGGLWSFTVGSGVPAEWFGPGTPLQPVAQDQAIGRGWDFPTGYNIQTRPKPNEGITFQELRNLSDGYDLLRLVIETRKDQIEKLSWSIKKRGEKVVKKSAAPDARIARFTDFLAYPDLEHPFGTWIRMLSEDVFVLDAPAVYNRRTRGGELYALELIDGATIKRVLDPTGRTPLEGPAYQQIIKGVVACEYTRNELLYMPRNPRTHRAFGFSPVEQVSTTVNIALRRQLHQLSYYTDGNTPNLIFGVPKEWNPDHIKKFQEWWDSLMSGNSAMRSKARFVPGDVKPMDTKEHALKDDYDEWLARIVCFAFSIPATALVKETNRATAQTVQKAALSEGLAPVMMWVKALMDRILRDCFGAPDLEFAWSDEQSIEPLVQAQIDDLDVKNRIRDINECREARGMEALSPEELEARKPVPPPSPFGAGEDAPPSGKPTADKPPVPREEKPAATEKLAKAAKVMKPINRDRKSLQKLEAKLKKVTAAFLKEQVRPIAEALAAAMPPTAEKMAKMSDDEAKQLLEASNIDWHELGDDLEPILAAIAQDGVAQGLAQVGATTTADLLDQVNTRAVAWAEQHSADLVTKLAATTRDRLRGDLAAGIELGMSAADIADVIAADYGFSEERAELIARTERAFADIKGNQMAYAASGVVGGLQWIVANEGDDKVCEDCEQNDGAVVPMDPETGEATEAFPSGDTAAPAHPDCVLPGTLVTAAGVSKYFERRFEGEIVRILIQGQDALSVTPNHPILTRRGWVAAREIQEGEDVFLAPDPAALARACNPDNHHVESRIEEMARALHVSGGVTTVSMPSTTEDFHGDGLLDQDVRVISADCGLASGPEPGGEEQIPQNHLLITADDLERFARGGDTLTVNLGLPLPTDSLMGFGRPGASGIGGGVGSLNQIGGPFAANRQANPNPGLSQAAAMASGCARQIDAALASLVTPVKVLQIVKGEPFVGHVFNLQTEGGWYLANSIITHNCRCDLLPVLTDEGEES